VARVGNRLQSVRANVHAAGTGPIRRAEGTVAKPTWMVRKLRRTVLATGVERA
jgi:hypothetical protein